MESKRWGVLGIVMFGAGLLLFSMESTRQRETALGPHRVDLANGETMFNAGGCASCHSAPLSEAKCDSPKGGTRLELAGGRCFHTEYGTFYAPNISTDRDDGIGGWSEADFVNAMTRGLSPEGEHYYPAFPYTSYQRMSIADVRDLKAFMDRLPAVRAASRDHELAFPYSIRWGLGLWKMLYLDGERFRPDPGKSADFNRGAYLVLGPGHCGECHTPRNPLGGFVADRWLAGGPAPEGKGYVPNLTPHASGLGSWSKSDIAYALKSGFTPEFDVLGGNMTKVQENLARLSDADRQAIAAYLKALPPVASVKSKSDVPAEAQPQAETESEPKP